MSGERIHWRRDDDGVVTLTLDEPGRPVNTIGPEFMDEWLAATARLEAERADVAGVILTSGKETFLGGADLNVVVNLTPDGARDFAALADRFKIGLRRLETLGRPVVAALNGAALGGGYEMSLACHHRVAVRGSRARFGLPEVTLGLLPGAGIVRTVRLLGAVEALTVLLLRGTSYAPEDALEHGLISALVDAPGDLVAAAKRWIAANPDARQPWDRPGFRIPGHLGDAPERAAVLAALPATLRAQADDGPFLAPRLILDAAVAAARLSFDEATKVEADAFLRVLLSPQSKSMTRAFFFDLQELAKGATRPAGVPRRDATRVAILGAGMMGAGIAWQVARAGLPVVLKDVSMEAAEKGKELSRKLVARSVADGKTTPQAADALLARIATTDDVAALAGCDVVIEAVFEDTALKQQVFRETESRAAPDAVLASNTSQIPIATLAESVSRPEDFIGLHFFSPVEKMPLVEVVVGPKTSDATLARAIDFATQIRFTPLVVRDSRGFFTTRVILQFLAEAFALVLEGVDPAAIEHAATSAGYPVGPLQLADELNLRTARKAVQDAAGHPMVRHDGFRLIGLMLDEHDRPGRLAGRGFYDYDASGKRLALWPGLRPAYRKDVTLPVADLRERMMFVQALDATRCFAEGVIASHATANFASLRAIGFPAWTGGVVRYVDQYEGGTRGFVARARALAAAYGERFAPPVSLVELAERGAPFEAPR